ncbi:MAG: hypothetical protein HC923_12000 [Myxococcales bacterium]|nr:hypothetical protein [Myxococcales bacterium]
MASNTKKTELKRLKKGRAAGRDRKKANERNGTTRSEAEIFGNALSR